MHIKGTIHYWCALSVLCVAPVVLVAGEYSSKAPYDAPKDQAHLRRMLKDRTISAEGVIVSLRANGLLSIGDAEHALVIRNAHIGDRKETKQERDQREIWDLCMLDYFCGNGLDVVKARYHNDTLTALQWCLWNVTSPHQINARAIGILYYHGARLCHKNNNGESTMHFLVRKIWPYSYAADCEDMQHLRAKTFASYTGTIKAVVDAISVQTMFKRVVKEDLADIHHVPLNVLPEWCNETIVQKAEAVGMHISDIAFLQNALVPKSRNHDGLAGKIPRKATHKRKNQRPAKDHFAQSERERQIETASHLLRITEPYHWNKLGIRDDILREVMSRRKQRSNRIVEGKESSGWCCCQ